MTKEQSVRSIIHQIILRIMDVEESPNLRDATRVLDKSCLCDYDLTFYLTPEIERCFRIKADCNEWSKVDNTIGDLVQFVEQHKTVTTEEAVMIMESYREKSGWTGWCVIAIILSIIFFSYGSR